MESMALSPGDASDGFVNGSTMHGLLHESSSMTSLGGKPTISLPLNDTRRQGIMSRSLMFLLVEINDVWLVGVIASFGILANIINIVVFIRMGLNDAVNISLLGLAVGDIVSLIFLIWNSVCFNPIFRDTPIPVVFTEIQYVTGGWPHVCFTRVTSWITAFVTFERCLCIAMPLKVKTIITTRRAKIVVTAIFLVMMITASPEYYVNQISWKFYPEKNKTLLGLVFAHDRERFEIITFVLNNIILQIVSFFSVIIFTIVLIVKLNQKTRWRQKSTAAETGNTVSNKDKKVIKMVTFISTIFIICYLPSIIIFVAMSIEFEFRPTGIYWNAFNATWSFAFVLEGLNSSVNIIVYLLMSSKYNAVFRETFPCFVKCITPART